jgi:hypothetical protein
MVTREDTALFLILNEHFGSRFNKACFKLISIFIMSLIKLQVVNFTRLSNSLNSRYKNVIHL